MKNLRRTLTVTALLTLPLYLASAQTVGPEPTEEPPVEPEDDGKVRPEDLFPDDPVRKEIVDLFHRVERKLAEIDVRLADAGAGDAPLSDVEDSGIDDLLRSTGAESQSVVRDIDRILELAAQLGGSSVGSSMQQPDQGQPQGQSPLDQERDRGPTEREQTPEDPTQGHEQQEPSSEAQEPDGADPDQGPGDNVPGAPPAPTRAGDSAGRRDDADRWGDLPVRFRETFRNQGGEEVPVQYRDWIDSYYRRLNRTR